MPGRAVSYKARRTLPTASGLAQAPAGALQAGARPGSPRGSEGTLQAIAFTSLCFWTQVAEARQDDGLGPMTPTPWCCALPAPVPGTWLPPPPPPFLVTRVHLSSPQQGGQSLSLSGGWQVERQRTTPASGSPRWNSGRHAARLALRQRVVTSRRCSQSICMWTVGTNRRSSTPRVTRTASLHAARRAPGLWGPPLSAAPASRL